MLRELFQLTPDALVVVDGEGRIVTANQKAEALFDYPQGSLEGLAIESLMPESVRGRHRQHRDAYMRSPRVRPMGTGHMNLVGRKRNGTVFPVEIALAPLESQDGRFYLASVRDFSSTQSARQAQQRARYDALLARIGSQALAATDLERFLATLPQQLSSALNVETVAVVLLNRDGSIESQAIAGEAALSEDADAEFAHLAGSRDQREVIVDALESSGSSLPMIRERHGSGMLLPLTRHGVLTGALLAWSRKSGHFDHDAQHLLRSVALMLVELMQRRQTEDQLAHMQRLEALGQMTGGVAHDFNNMLTVLSGNLQLLELECEGRPECGKLVASAQRALAHGAELTRKLLAFARRQPLEPESLDPRNVIDDVCMLLDRTLGSRVQLKVECADELPPVYADAAQLEATLLNLALNARDAMPHGGELVISVEKAVRHTERSGAHADGQHIAFVVSDTGHGMSAETLASAIEPFFTTKAAGRGTGLGLSMAYGFATQSGGGLELDSQLGYGTRVTLLLPAISGEVAAAASGPALVGSPVGGGERVLVVEDEPDVSEVTIDLLRSLGYRVQAVDSVERALALLQGEHGIDLLFSDIRLGAGGDGRLLARRVRQHDACFPVLLTTAHAPAGRAAAEDIPGADIEVLRKPYDREDLAAAIRRCLDT